MIAVLLHCSMLYCQGKEIKQHIIGNDTFFIMNKNYAKWVLNKFDTLNHIKAKLEDCNEIIGMLNNHTELLKTTITKKDDIIKTYEIELSETNHILDSYKRNEVLQEGIQKALDKEKKEKGIWKGLAIFGVSSTIVTSAILAIILKP